MKKTNLWFIVCLLLMILALPSCAINRFPTGQFSNLMMTHCVLELHKNHTWTNEVNGVIVGSGTYSIQGDKFILHMDHVNQVSDANAFTYTWSYEDDILTLTLAGNDGYPEQFRKMKTNLAWTNLNNLKLTGMPQTISILFHILQELVAPLTLLSLYH